MKTISQLIIMLTTLSVLPTAPAFAQSDASDAAVLRHTANSKSASGIRNKRYCEIIPINFQGGKFVASVYCSLGQEECPPEVWKAMDVKAIKKQFNAFKVVLNGPRYWTMDEIIAKGKTGQGQSVKIGGFGFTKRAEIALSPLGLKSIPYKEREIQRETQYVFKAGKPIYELTSADGQVYVMQSYAQIVDPKLTVDDLPGLSNRLKLPKGWKYRTMTPNKDVVLSADGIAHLIQDDLRNSYQRIEPGDADPGLGAPATK